MSIRCAFFVVALCFIVVLSSGCALKVYEVETPSSDENGAESGASADEVPIPAAIGRFEISEFDVRANAYDETDRDVIYRWEYTNDTDETITEVVGWICRVHDVDGFVIATQDIKIYPRKYGPLEPGVKVRGVRQIRVSLDGEIDRVSCVGQS